MKIGIVKEIKNNENRVGLTPGNVLDYIRDGHSVLVESNAGVGSGFSDEEYINVGAVIVNSQKEAWDVDMVIKVKEPQVSEYKYFKEGLILFTYLHLANEKALTEALIEYKVTGIAYETVLVNNTLPLLRPMSEVAGRRSVTIGAHFLEKVHGGPGILLGGVAGTESANVVIIGGGVAGFNAAEMAIGLGANVTILEMNENKIRYLQNHFGLSAKIIKSSTASLVKYVKCADLLISPILIPGARAPKIVTEEMVKSMKEGSVVVDISIDQGGSVATIDQVTTHDAPIFVKHGVQHYSVANMPGATPRTSTIALTNATNEYGLLIANYGIKALEIRSELVSGLNTYNGYLTHHAVSNALDMKYSDYTVVH